MENKPLVSLDGEEGEATPETPTEEEGEVTE